MKVISTDKAPAAIGPYSQAIDMGAFIFCSGQIPINPATGQMADNAVDQARQSMENVKSLLAAAGTSLDKVVKTTIFLKNLEDFGAINEVYASFFSGTFPARSCVEVARLPKDALIEIEVIAVK